MAEFFLEYSLVKVAALCLLIVGVTVLGASALAQNNGQSTTGHALLMSLDGGIGPASSEYIDQGLHRAGKGHARLVILKLDTPGGLGTAMRHIVKAMLNASVPVVVYVAPSGARAASAGTYITYAANIAAMAPATNIGAATPVSLGGGGSKGGNQEKSEKNAKSGPASSRVAERRKVVNDAVAYIQTLAQKRNRNAAWAEKAVREGVSLTAEDAVKKNVVNLIAPNLHALLDEIDGDTVTVGGQNRVLHTKNLDVKDFDPSWRIAFLSVLSNPTLAYILLMAGIIGLVLEGLNPGGVLPGVVGAICVILALFAFHMLPVNYAGLALLALGVVLMIAEALAPSFGVLGFGGIFAFVFGSVMLMDTSVPGFEIPLGIIFGIAFVAVLAICGVLFMFWRSRGHPVRTGSTGLVGANVEALEAFDKRGWVRVHGERWRALTDSPMRNGQSGRVISVDGLTLTIEPGATHEPPTGKDGEGDES